MKPIEARFQIRIHQKFEQLAIPLIKQMKKNSILSYLLIAHTHQMTKFKSIIEMFHYNAIAGSKTTLLTRNKRQLLVIIE